MTEETCASFWPSEIQGSYTIHLVVLVSVVALLTVFSNSLLIYSLVKTKQYKLVQQKLILMMNASDLMHGAVVMPAFAVALASRHRYGVCLLEQGTHYGLYLFGYFSFFMLMWISFDRLWQLKRINTNGSSVTVFQMKLLAMGFFVISNVTAYIGVKFISFPFQLAACICNICLISTVIVVYTILLRKIRVHSLSFTNAMVNYSVSRRTTARIDMTATRTIWLLLLALGILYAPFNITTPMVTYYMHERKTEVGAALSLATTWAYLLVFAYCTMNAVIFGSGNGKVRRFVSKLVRDSLNLSNEEIANAKVVPVNREILP